jgi:hypothetical protein
MAVQCKDKVPCANGGGTSDVLSIVLGAILIAGFVPGIQWLDRGSVGNSLETDVPTPAGVGLLVGIIFLNAIFWTVGRFRLFRPKNAVLLYVMLSVSLPFCSTGLVHSFLGSITAVAREHLDRQIPTIQQAYVFQDSRFFPKISETDYKEYQRLFDEGEAGTSQEGDIRNRQREILLPLKRFWSGVYADPEERERYANPEWGTWNRLDSSFRAVPWRIWLPVFVHWGLFFLLVLIATMCLAEILRREWIDHENLSFPIAQAPLALACHTQPKDQQEEAGRSPAPFFGLSFWCGVTIGTILLLLAGLAHYKMLNIPLDGPVTFQRIDFGAILVNPPWNILRNNVLFLSPLMVGIALLVNQEILRGVLWTFAGLQVLRMFGVILEVPLSRTLGSHWQSGLLPSFAELGTGATLVFVLFLLWRSRKAFNLGFRRTEREQNGYLPRRWVGLGFLASLVGMVVFFYRLGLTGVSGLFFVLLVFIWTWMGAVALARCRSEGGLPLSTANFVGSDMMMQAGGAGTFGLSNMIVNGQMFFLSVAALPSLLASQIEGLFLAAKLRVSARRLAVAVMVAFCVAVFVGMLSCLVLSYWVGSQNMMNTVQDRGATPITLLFLRGDVQFDTSPVQLMPCVMVIVGVCIMVGLFWLRERFPRFSIPPICFLIVCLGTVPFHRAEMGGAILSQPVNFIWGPMLIAYIVKRLLLRYGGMDLYVRSVPAALGLIVSQAVMIVFWNLYHAFAAPSGGSVFTGIFQ